ncbi:hypothetical protein A9Q77_08105 [Marinomonas sp. 42_23_T18]|nr:hypothetical protein A9Q77_08105 [Marinomonas sp. 42_23_T18]
MKTVLFYTILKGDTLSGIATSINHVSGVTGQQIEAANPAMQPNALEIGQEIKIPSPTGKHVLTYTILSGDTLFGICSALSQCAALSYQNIEQDNLGVTASDIQPGQLLSIPATQSTPEKSLSPIAENMGYWDCTWQGGNAPSNATLSLAFSGWVDVKSALEDSNTVLNNLVGCKYISFGGGNENGAFDSANLADLTDAINQGALKQYDGIAYDVEEGVSGLEDDFKTSFKAAKAKGFNVLVTISHSAPYDISDASLLMDSFFDDANIDILSPQLYTTGEETENNYETSHGVNWARYATCKAAIVPSLVTGSLYPSAQSYFSQQGVTLQGYIQWKHI